MRPYPFSIFEELAAIYSGPLPRLVFKQGHESEINKLQSSDDFPILFVCEQPNLTVRNVRPGLDEIRFRLYLLRQAPRTGNGASTVQQDAERLTELKDDMQRVSEQLCRALQYQIPEVDYSSIRWESTPLITSGQFLVGVQVTGQFVIRNSFCRTDFVVPPTVYQIVAATTTTQAIPQGAKDGDIIEFINEGAQNPGVFIGPENWPENARLIFRAREGTTVTIAHNYAGNGIQLSGGFNAVLEADSEIQIQRVGSSNVYVEVSRVGIQTFANGIYIAGLGGTHETEILANYLAQYPQSEPRIIRGWENRNTQENNARTFFVQFMQACGYRVEQILCGYINIFSGNLNQQWLFFSSQCPSIVVPIGPNSNTEVTYPADFQGNIVRVSAGDSQQRLQSYGNSLEFWDTSNSNSNVTPIGAAKLMRIADLRADYTDRFQKHAASRYAARVTAERTEITHGIFSQEFDITFGLGGAPWNKFNGYGKIDVDAAVAFNGQVTRVIFTQEFDFSFSLTFG